MTKESEMRKATMTALALASLLAACGTLPADGDRATARTDWPEAFAQGIGLAPAGDARADWWTALGDPVLDRLVAQGLQSNLDLQQAAGRVQRSRALAAGAAAQRWPGGEVALGARSQQASAAEMPGADRSARRSDSASATIGLGWELDLFGRLATLSDAAQARTRAVEADAEAMRLAVGAEIAQAWFSLNGAREQRRLAQQVGENRRTLLDLVQRRVAAGYSSRLDEARAAADLADAESELPRHEAAIAVAVHRLAVLLGASPTGFEAPLAVDTAPRPVGLRVPEPARWAAQRPDLQAAEARLRAQSLEVDAVRAEFLPRVSITGVLGWVAGSVSGLGAAGSAAWFVAPTVSLPVFDQARIAARLDAARAGEREALLAYRQTMLHATEEVESALASVRHGQVRLSALQARAGQATTAEQLARQRFVAGSLDLTDMLEVQRTAWQAEQALAAALTVQQQQVVTLQRALGARHLPLAADAADLGGSLQPAARGVL